MKRHAIKPRVERRDLGSAQAGEQGGLGQGFRIIQGSSPVKDRSHGAWRLYTTRIRYARNTAASLTRASSIPSVNISHRTCVIRRCYEDVLYRRAGRRVVFGAAYLKSSRGYGRSGVLTRHRSDRRGVGGRVRRGKWPGARVSQRRAKPRPAACNRSRADDDHLHERLRTFGRIGLLTPASGSLGYRNLVGDAEPRTQSRQLRAMAAGRHITSRSSRMKCAAES